MNFRLRQERNAFVFLVVVATPLLLLSAPLPYLTRLAGSNSSGFRAAKLEQVGVEQSFARADRNHDGFIDASEASAIPGLLPIFAIVDLNGDGKIDLGELAKVRPARSRAVEART